jgi:hypothetical protein
MIKKIIAFFKRLFGIKPKLPLIGEAFMSGGAPKDISPTVTTTTGEGAVLNTVSLLLLMEAKGDPDMV